MGVLQWEMVNRQSRAVPKAFGIEQMCGLAHKHLQQSQNRRRKSSALQASSTKTKKRGLTSLSVVPPGNISKCVTYCVLALLVFSLIQCSRIAHGYNSPFFTTLYRLFSTATKVVNFLDFRARKRGYNFVATKPKYLTPYRASCRAA